MNFPRMPRVVENYNERDAKKYPWKIVYGSRRTPIWWASYSSLDHAHRECANLVKLINGCTKP
jgi:hypothetical protein